MKIYISKLFARFSFNSLLHFFSLFLFFSNAGIAIGGQPVFTTLTVTDSRGISDQVIFRNQATAQSGFDFYDGSKLENDHLNVFSVLEDGKYLVIDARPFETQASPVTIGLKNDTIGLHQFSFSDEVFFQSVVITDLSNGQQYQWG
ncbi:hypothetical protein [Persicobacter sp. CCB-QB2]|uniref:hypothetical protein n=1 Tax=Persicobacter sp. CCB-QB2 TaxID=1561025 RepID=UPI0006A967FE|nr:hypothetical protein [Persicobacter sp. CCB-QB2]